MFWLSVVAGKLNPYAVTSLKMFGEDEVEDADLAAAKAEKLYYCCRSKDSLALCRKVRLKCFLYCLKEWADSGKRGEICAVSGAGAAAGVSGLSCGERGEQRALLRGASAG